MSADMSTICLEQHVEDLIGTFYNVSLTAVHAVEAFIFPLLFICNHICIDMIAAIFHGSFHVIEREERVVI